MGSRNREPNQGDLTPGELLDLRRRLEAERVDRTMNLQRQFIGLWPKRASMTRADFIAATIALIDAVEASERRYETESAAADNRLQESERFAPLDQLESFGWLADPEPLAISLKDLLK